MAIQFFSRVVFLCLMSFLVLAADLTEEIPTRDDLLCIDHAHMVFHAYAQYLTLGSKESEHIDFKTPATYRRLFGLWQEISKPVADDLLKGWQFFPIYGQTGLMPQDMRITTISFLSNSLIGMIGYHSEDNIIIVSFRGTRQFSDWFNNSNLSRQVPSYIDEPIALHSGYVNIVEGIKNRLVAQLAAIKENIDPSRRDSLKIFVTGHSLGGAVASVAVALIKHVFRDFGSIGLRVFGAPRVGYSDYDAWLTRNNIEAKTYARSTDPIPYLSSFGTSFLGRLIILPHYYDFLWPMCHDPRKYRRALYERYNEKAHENQKIPLTELFDINVAGLITF